MLNLLKNLKNRPGVLDFKGSENSYTQVNNGYGLLNDAFTFETWIYLDSYKKNVILLNKEDIEGNVKIVLNKKDITISVNNTLANFTTTLLDSNLKLGKWQHIALSISSNKKELVINGKPQQLKTLKTQRLAEGVNTDEIFVIGKGLDGKLDEVRIHRQAKQVKDLGFTHQGSYAIKDWDDNHIQMYWEFNKKEAFIRDTFNSCNSAQTIKSVLHDYPSLKIRLGVGHGEWKDMVKNPNARKRFTKQTIDFVKNYGFDGVDIDFEWAYNEAEWQSYSVFLEEFGKSFPKELTYTITLHALFHEISPKAIEYADYISIQSYGPSSSRFPYNQFVKDIDKVLTYGFPSKKIVMGLPFYGTGNKGIKAPLGYKYIIEQYPNIDQEPNRDIVTFDYKDRKYTKGDKKGTLIGVIDVIFNNKNTIIKKNKLINDMNLKGTMFWYTGSDVKAEDNRALINALNKQINPNIKY